MRVSGSIETLQLVIKYVRHLSHVISSNNYDDSVIRRTVFAYGTMIGYKWFGVALSSRSIGQ